MEHFQDDLEIETLRNAGYRFQANFEISQSSNEHLPFIKKKANKKLSYYGLSFLIVIVLLILAFRFF